MDVSIPVSHLTSPSYVVLPTYSPGLPSSSVSSSVTASSQANDDGDDMMRRRKDHYYPIISNLPAFRHKVMSFLRTDDEEEEKGRPELVCT